LLNDNWQGKTDVLEGKLPIPFYPPPPIPCACPLFYTRPSGEKLANTNPTEGIFKNFMKCIKKRTDCCSDGRLLCCV